MRGGALILGSLGGVIPWLDVGGRSGGPVLTVDPHPGLKVILDLTPNYQGQQRWFGPGVANSTQFQKQFKVGGQGPGPVEAAVSQGLFGPLDWTPPLGGQGILGGLQGGLGSVGGREARGTPEHVGELGDSQGVSGGRVWGGDWGSWGGPPSASERGWIGGRGSLGGSQPWWRYQLLPPDPSLPCPPAGGNDLLAESGHLRVPAGGRG